MSTLLADLVRRQTALSVLNVFNRTIDKVAEELAQDLLRDPTFRDEMRELIRVAFATALEELHQPAPAPEANLSAQRLEQLLERLRRIEQRLTDRQP